MFRRRKDDPTEDAPTDDAPTEDAPTDAEPVAEAFLVGGWTPDPAPAGPAPLVAGPFDEADVPPDGLPRLDLGGMRVPVFEGGELRVEVDEESGAVVGATVVTEESALQLHAFAAPRGTGIWDEVRREIAASIEASGGTAQEGGAGFGTELHATVPAQLPDGSIVAAPARFVGVDGPRWFLRGVFTGPAALDPEAAALLETAFRRVVVVRGGEPMAPRDPIPLRLPPEIAELPPEMAEPPEGPDDTAGDRPGEATPGFDPFHRGPEITEVR